MSTGDARSPASGAKKRIAVVLNPRAAVGSRAAPWSRAIADLAERAVLVAQLETRGDGGDVERITAMVDETQPDVLAAAGGDGTVNTTVAGLLRASARPALGLLPLGTGDDAARSLGLLSFRSEGQRAVALAVAAIIGARRREIDVGLANEQPFAGSFAIGMDADILALRNRLRRRFGLGGTAGGYALYLWSCAMNVLASRHGGQARIMVDGVEETRRIYNLLVINMPIYAGEFRFDGDNDCADGRLDLHAVRGAGQYLSEYPRAWRRHVNARRGAAVSASPLLRRAREIVVDLDRSVAAQLDGEEFGPASSYRIRVLPHALSVCLPP